jgi:signal transduction histidine kinase
MNTITISPLSITNCQSQKTKFKHTFTINRSKKQNYNLKLESLNLSKLESGIIEVCSSIIEEIESTINIDISINLTLKSNDSNIYLNTQSILLQPILLNLLSNAVTYSRGTKNHIELEILLNSNSVILIVRDRGIGIALTDQNRIFESFYRGKNTEKTQGSGIGLTVVKRCVELQGGKIDFESTLGKGSKFTVCLPLAI